MRRSNSSPSVALFPFLAVLVCAMGALILLLLVTTRKMRQVAVARALAEEAAAQEESAPPSVPVIPPEPSQPVESQSVPAGPHLTSTKPTAEELAAKEAERRAVRVAREARRRLNEEAKQRQAVREREWQRMLAELSEQRQAQVEKVRESKTLLDDLRSRLQRTEVNLKKLQEKKLQLEGLKDQDAAERAKIEKQNQELAEAITAAQKEMADLRRAHAEQASKFAFIPYDGASGTTRRPIYLECTAAGVRFQPEGVLLDEADLKGFTESHNPLLAGTQAIIEHWQLNPTRDDDPRRPRRPYVLMLVRPSGTISYYVARKMLSQIGDDFGYELIEDDFALQLPPTDAKTKTVIETAIAEALRHRGEALAEGTRVGAPRLNQVMMGRSEDTIEFGTLNGQVAAAAAQKESPFSKHSTRNGKNFSITRSPVRSEELLPDTFRSEIERHAHEKEVADALQGNSSAAGARGKNGTGQSGGAGTMAGDGTGAGDRTGSGTGGTNREGTTGQRGVANAKPGDKSGSGVEIQRGLGRRNQLGKSNGNGKNPTNSNGARGGIRQLPKLSDPFSRDSIAQDGLPEQPGNGDDDSLGFSGGVDQPGVAGMGRATGLNGGVPGGTEVASSRNSSRSGSGTGKIAVGNQGTSGTRARGPSIPGTRSANLLELQPGVQTADRGAGTDASGAEIPDAVPSGDLEQGATAGTSGNQPGAELAENPMTAGRSNQRGRAMAPTDGSGSSETAPGNVKSQVEFNDFSSDPVTGVPGQVDSSPSATAGQQSSSQGSPPNGTRSRGAIGRRTSGAANPFDKTQGAVVAEQFTSDAQRQMAESSGSSGGSSGAVKSRKSYGDHPEIDLSPPNRNKNRPKNLTTTQKQDYGRQRWGGNNVGQIGFERKVQVQVMADKFVIGKNEVEIEIEPGATREELVDSILDGLDASSQTWGTPPKKFYWVPYLQFEVYKGGVVQYEQVHAPLREWGLSSDVKFKEGLPGEHGLIQPVSTQAAPDTAPAKAATPKSAPPKTAPLKSAPSKSAALPPVPEGVQKAASRDVPKSLLPKKKAIVK